MNSTPIEFHKISIGQCSATEGIHEKFGLEDALNYPIGEKLFSFLHAAERDPLLTAEVPNFVTEIRHRHGLTLAPESKRRTGFIRICAGPASADVLSSGLRTSIIPRVCGANRAGKSAIRRRLVSPPCSERPKKHSVAVPHNFTDSRFRGTTAVEPVADARNYSLRIAPDVTNGTTERDNLIERPVPCPFSCQPPKSSAFSLNR